jgi:exopolysaccharide biosynthesis protein
MTPGARVKNLVTGRARTTLLASVGTLVFVLAASGFVAVRHALPFAALQLPPGYALTFDAVSYGGGAMHLSGVRIGDEQKTVAFDAARVDITGAGLGALLGRRERLDVVLTEPHLGLFREHATAADVRAAVSRVAAWEPLRAGLSIQISDGTLSVSPGLYAAPQIAVDQIAGTASVLSGKLTYDLDLAFEDGGTSFPVHGVASVDDREAITHRWTAAALPLVAVASLAPASGIETQGGKLSGVSLTYAEGAAGSSADPRLRATAHLEGATLTLADPSRHIRGLHGALTVVDDGLASPHLIGVVDGAPLEIVGETHDLQGAPLRWLSDGTEDLRALERLLASVVSQDHVQNARLETVAPGVALAQYTSRLSYGPIVVTAVSLNPRDPTLRLDTVLASDHLTSGGERTSAMGTRTNAVLGINGDYYDIGRSWVPQGVVIRSGVLLHTPAERMALTVHRDGRVTFGEYRFHGTARVGTNTVALTQLNDWPVGKATFMTPEYGRIPPAPGVTLAELDPVPGHPHQFRVTRVGPVTTPVEPTYGLALGPLARALPPQPGQSIEVNYDSEPAAADAVAAVGGGPLLLKDGAWFEDPHAPAPDEREAHWAVVALGRMADDSLMIVQVDGRHPERSIGITRPDFAELIRRHGVVDAMALDSGGSVTIVSRAPGEQAVSVRNHPSDDDGERWVANGLFAYSSAPPGGLLKPQAVGAAAPVADNSAR